MLVFIIAHATFETSSHRMKGLSIYFTTFGMYNICNTTFAAETLPIEVFIYLFIYLYTATSLVEIPYHNTFYPGRDNQMPRNTIGAINDGSTVFKENFCNLLGSSLIWFWSREVESSNYNHPCNLVMHAHHDCIRPMLFIGNPVSCITWVPCNHN